MQTATESPWIAHIYGWSDGMHNGKHFTTLPIKLERNDSHFKSKRCISFADSNEEELECHLLSKTNITKPSSGTFLLGPQVDMMISYTDLNIENGILVTKGELVMNWEDERMVWDPKKFGNQSAIKIEKDAMWKPCFVLSNEVFQDSLSNESYVGDLENTTCNSGWVYLKVFSNGNMTWASPMNLETKCNMSFNSWPWNPQTCHLNFTINTLDVTLNLSQKIELSGTLWRITKITRKHTTQNDFRCTVEITLKMKSNLLQVIVCFLFTGVSLVTLSSFLISPLNRTKPVSKASSLLLLVIFLVILMNSIPHFTTHASNFVVGYVVLLLMVGISGCITAYYVRLARKLLSYNAFLDMKISHPEENRYENDTMKTGLIETITSADDESSNKSQNEWLKVAKIIEYSSFTISLIVVLLLMTSLMS
ncbi:acetylcholine receptor subunit beta-like [Planococcus citri]|uniref:acetylcholine receptor subunit beta-like n=1 Tax=Planococcus citri TaxID=170843 RepID=UPI0031F98F56